MSTIEIEIDESARKEGIESLKKNQGSNTWRAVVTSLISGVDLGAFLGQHGDERVSPYTTVREYVKVLELHGLLLEKNGKTSINPSVLQDMPSFKRLAETEALEQGR